MLLSRYLIDPKNISNNGLLELKNELIFAPISLAQSPTENLSDNDPSNCNDGGLN